MEKYKVKISSPVFAYVNGELMHDYPKRTIKRGEIVEGDKQMLLLTDPDEGSQNLAFLRINDDKYIKLKNLKPMLNYSKNSHSNATGKQKYSTARQNAPCITSSGLVVQSGDTLQSGSFLYHCKNGTLSITGAHNGSQMNATGDDMKKMTPVAKYVVGAGVGLGLGLVISHFTGGKNQVAFIVGGLVAGIGGAWLVSKNETGVFSNPEPTKTTANAPTSSPERISSDDSGSEKITIVPSPGRSDAFAVVGNMMDNDAKLRKPSKGSDTLEKFVLNQPSYFLFYSDVPKHEGWNTDTDTLYPKGYKINGTRKGNLVQFRLADNSIRAIAFSKVSPTKR